MLTKSKIVAWRQCPKRLWLEDRGAPGAAPAVGRLARGLSVGDLAQRLLGDEQSVALDRKALTRDEALAHTAELLAAGRTVFEGAFGDEGLVVYVDAARPTPTGWELIEVKDSGSTKPHHIEDAAIQAAAAQRSGSSADRVIIAHLDTGWVYPGEGDYRGLFAEADVTEATGLLAEEVEGWMAGALDTLASETQPDRATGRHCGEPYACQYSETCLASEPVIERPLSWLPGPLRKEAKALRDAGARSMDELPDDTLSAAQLRVKTQTLLNEAYFDQPAAAAELAGCAFPLHFLDFETANPAIPLWAGTRPYAQTPFQFSLQVVSTDGRMDHREFLFATGEEPSRPFAEALIGSLGSDGAIVVYNVGFERTRIRELAGRYPDLAAALNAMSDRIFDLQPVARAHYYHPAQCGSWSVKKVLPCLVPELRYDQLDGVQDGTMAIEAYLEMIDPRCSVERRAALDNQLRRYCRLDTLAMVALWAQFAGSGDLLRRVVSEVLG